MRIPALQLHRIGFNSPMRMTMVEMGRFSDSEAMDSSGPSGGAIRIAWYYCDCEPNLVCAIPINS